MWFKSARDDKEDIQPISKYILDNHMLHTPIKINIKTRKRIIKLYHVLVKLKSTREEKHIILTNTSVSNIQ